MWYSNEQVKEKLLEYVLSCLQHLSEHYFKNQWEKRKILKTPKQQTHKQNKQIQNKIKK